MTFRYLQSGWGRRSSIGTIVIQHDTALLVEAGSEDTKSRRVREGFLDEQSQSPAGLALRNGRKWHDLFVGVRITIK